MYVDTSRQQIRVLTWHVHGSYLYYLSQTPCTFIVPVKNDGTLGYSGRSGPFAWGKNVIEVPAERIKNIEFDCILYQHTKNYLEDRHVLLSDKQKKLPYIYLEHDPPREVPTDTKHIVDDPEAILVHVTHFNRLMWDNGRTPAYVIEHAVHIDPEVRYTGEIEKGVVVINNAPSRGRRLGLDILLEARQRIPLDIVGMGSAEIGGLGEIPPPELAAFIAKYRFFFNPIRYTSLGLAVCEAMTVGLPVIGLATTEMPVVIENGVSGYIHTDMAVLIEKMDMLLRDREHANRLSRGAREVAQQKFDMRRFIAEWFDIFQRVTGRHMPDIETVKQA